MSALLGCSTSLGRGMCKTNIATTFAIESTAKLIIIARHSSEVARVRVLSTAACGIAVDQHQRHSIVLHGNLLSKSSSTSNVYPSRALTIASGASSLKTERSISLLNARQQTSRWQTDSDSIPVLADKRAETDKVSKHFRSNSTMNGLSNCDKHNFTTVKQKQFPRQQQQQQVAMLNQVIAKFFSTDNQQRLAGFGSSGGSGTPIEPDDQEKIEADPIGRKRIKINACGELYEELSRTRPHLFGSAPKGRGIDFDLNYYDSLELLKQSERSTAPTVCLLHGAPGHYKDFASLIRYLTGKGVRVIAPQFPNYSATFEHSFRHSPRERLDLLIRFFQAIKVDQIDLIVGHSSAVYTIFELLNHNHNPKMETMLGKVRVNSLGLFSTPSYNLPRNLVVTPFRLFTLKLFDYPMLRPLILALIMTFVKIQGIRNRVDRDNIENLLIAASAVGYSDSDNMREYLKMVRELQVPTYLLVGGNDRLIPMRCFDQLKSDLGVSGDKQVKYYNDKGELTKDMSEPNDLVQVAQFESGGHYAFQRFSQQVNEDIYQFLTRKVLPSQSISTKL